MAETEDLTMKVRIETEWIRHIFTNKVMTLILSALGFCAALAWNEALGTTIKTQLSGLLQTGGLFVYALAVTVIAVLAAYLITKIFPETETKA